MKELRVFYKMRLYPSEIGLYVSTEKWHLIHETDCFYFVIPEWALYLTKINIDEGKSLYQHLKGRTKIKRFGKGAGRFAFDTKEQAFQHLKFLKRKQLRHLERDMAMVKSFLKQTGEKELGDLETDSYGDPLLPNTKNLVEQYFTLD